MAETGANGKGIASDSPLFHCWGAAKVLQRTLPPPLPLLLPFWCPEDAKALLLGRSEAAARAVEGFTGHKACRPATVYIKASQWRATVCAMSDVTSGQLPYFTLGEAARQAGVSKPTLSKAISSGRLSAEKQPDGSYRIQPAELFRVYPPEYRGNRFDRSEVDERETGSDDRLAGGEVVYLRERLALLTEERER